mmetsp:Transcript_32549/g.64538  ORF Transcript_32549/g.64538 Transcript_32549/m.64538 type:complete len:196 (+) Transcript_32549:1-588(+)
MAKRWERETGGGERRPLKFVDKMLSNYNNIGFIHLLYPQAVILHVYRNPMDTLLSAYKHDFPDGRLDYASEFASLATMYRGYRDIIGHWDKVLPGRVTHVKYEDLVRDLPGSAAAIVRKLGLDWDDGVLDFHNRVRATNTMSTSQVRVPAYTTSIESWRKYEGPLKALREQVGRDYYEFDLKSSLDSLRPDQHTM